MFSASILVAILLLIGHRVRMRFTVFDRIYIPASVIAGVFGLAVVQLAARLPLLPAANAFLNRAAASLQNWPAILIAIVFAAMLLQRSATSLRLGLRETLSEAVMVWIIALGQTAIGLALTWLVIQPLYGVPNAFGMLIETGFAGGHGTAAAMGQIFMTPEIALPVGRDLGMLMATAGLVYGTVSGIFWINLAMRRGLARPRVVAEEYPADDAPAAAATTAAPHKTMLGIRPQRLALQLLWIVAAYVLGLGMQAAIGEIALRLDRDVAASNATEVDATVSDATEVDATASDAVAVDVAAPAETNATSNRTADALTTVNKSVAAEESNAADVSEAGDGQPAAPMLEKLRWASLVGNFPLFIYTLFSGLVIARLLILIGRGNLLDGQASGRISTVAMDLLVVAAITTLNLRAVALYLLPITLLFVGGAIWSAICLLVLSPRILPRSHWFELGLINYGMSTGTTATGFVLLRLVDPQLRTEAAKHYALAAPLSAPFVGGGVVTLALPLLILQRVPISLAVIVVSTIVGILILCGMKLARVSPVVRRQ